MRKGKRILQKDELKCFVSIDWTKKSLRKQNTNDSFENKTMQLNAQNIFYFFILMKKRNTVQSDCPLSNGLKTQQIFTFFKR